LKLRPSTALVFLAVLAGSIPAAARAFSLEDVMSAPFVDHLTASPDGTVLVWKVFEQGRYNLYTNAGGTPHRVTPYMSDDGLDIDDVHIFASDDAVVYARGGVSDNGTGENINPLSIIPPPARTVYIAPLNGGAPVAVGEGLHGIVSPKSDAVAWVKDGVLQIATLQKAGTAYTVGKAEPLAIKGQVQNAVWSPDGSRIAFTNLRGDHAFIVMYDIAAKRYVYATPDFSTDDFAAWAPDGKSVAFIRMPGNREDESPYLDPPRQPWSIWVADAQSGNARMVWQARRGMGAQYYFSETSSRQLWWMRGERLAFLWEGDGWQHLYSVPLSGGREQRLTSGTFEVETVSQSLDRSKLLYATNENDIDRRHIWEVGLDAAPHALTSGTENQWSPTPLASSQFAYINAGYNIPPTVTVGVPGKSLIGEPTPSNFPANELVQPQLVTFRAPDGLLIHGQLFVPRGGGKHPAVVFDHGGPVRQMLPGFHYMDAYTYLYEVNQYLVNRGFVVLSINYRSGIMYGHNFRQAKKIGWLGASEYQDVVAGARMLQKRNDIDPNRLGIYGLSYGGYLTAMGLARNSDIFKAGGDIAGVHNWATIFDEGNGGKPLGTPAQRKVAYDSSPIASLNSWRSPVLISQGDDDRNVPFAQGVDMATRLRDRGVHVETLVFPNETHENQVWRDLVARYQAVADFLVRQLK
jgi:dipeptidyl aminopeptidase/acylaminoacyl peptidase